MKKESDKPASTTKEPMEIKTKGYATKDLIVRPAGHSGRIYVPKSWNGKPVRVILLEEPSND